MKKTIAIILQVALLLSLVIYPLQVSAATVLIDETNFPDEKFREFVSTKDLDGDGSLSDREVAKVTTVSVSDKGISSLKGIEFLTNVKKIYASNNNLTQLDLSENSVLDTLNLSGNKITELDFTNNPLLLEVNGSGMGLEKINVKLNPALKILNLSNNNLEEIDLTKNGELTTLSISKNSLKSLDLSKNTKLTSIFATNNHIVAFAINDTALSQSSPFHVSDQTIEVKLSKDKTGDSFRGGDFNQPNSVIGSKTTITPASVTYDQVTGQLVSSNREDTEATFELFINNSRSKKMKGTIKLTYLTDKEQLQKSYDKDGATKDSAAFTNATDQAKEAYLKALAKAGQLLAEENPAQGDVDQALLDLDQARQGLDGDNRFNLSTSKVTRLDPPDLMSYLTGEELDLTGLKVQLTDHNGFTESPDYTQFEKYGITIDYKDRQVLKVNDNGASITVTKGDQSLPTPELTVGERDKSALADLISICDQTLELDIYKKATESKKQEFFDNLTKAKEVIGDPDATEGQIDQARANLEEAKANLDGFSYILTDKITGVAISVEPGTFEKVPTLVVEPVEAPLNGYVTKAYDIYFIIDGNRVQPKHSVTVLVPLGNLEGKDLKVFHKTVDNPVDYHIIGQKVVFQAEDFSVYILAAKAASEPKAGTVVSVGPKTPATGDPQLEGIGLLLAVSAMGILVVARRKQERE